MNKYSHPLAITSVRVLEDWAMMMVEPSDVAPDSSSETLLVASVQFKGAVSGSVEVTATDEFARTLASNVLGISIDDEGISAYGIDSLKEFGNILTGNFLTEAYGSDTVFSLSIPIVSKKADDQTRSQVNDERLNFIFEADSCPVAITISTEKVHVD